MEGKRPLKLLENRVWRIYSGGKLLDEFRSSEKGMDGFFPEDWIASVVRANNPPRENSPEKEGLSRVCSGEYLRDVLERDAEYFLGKAHADRFGSNFGVLTKLLDSAQRLPVQVHPDKKAAKRLFGSDYGKTEAWHILDVRKTDGEEPYILLGFKEDVSRLLLKSLFDNRDVEGIKQLLHKIPVKPGDTFIIKGSTPHAIGPGCFLLEIQEPTDYTISLERTDPSGKELPDFMCHQGLGFERMFDCFNYEKMSEEELRSEYEVLRTELFDSARLRCESLISYQATPCFALNRYEVKGECELPSSLRARTLVVVGGAGCIDGIGVRRADSLFVPAQCGSLRVRPEGGALTLIECLPPEID